MNYRYTHSGCKGKQDNTFLGAVLRNAFSLLHYTPATPSFCETAIPLSLSFLLPSPLHLEGQRTWSNPVSWTAPFKHPFPARLPVLPNVTKIPEYSLWLWPAADPLSISGCWTAEKLGRRPRQTPCNPMLYNSQYRIPISLLAVSWGRGYRSDLARVLSLFSSGQQESSLHTNERGLNLRTEAFPPTPLTYSRAALELPATSVLKGERQF